MKAYAITLFVIILTTFTSFFAKGQVYFPEDMVKITGQMVDTETGESLPNVQVLNFRVHGGTMSDNAGKFSIQADPSDTLTFKLLGYKEKKIAVKELIGKKEYEKIPLTINRFVIEGAQVEAKSRPLNLGIPKGKENQVPLELRSEDFANKPKLLSAIFNPIAYMHYKLSKTEKEKRILIGVIHSEKEWQILSLLYNKDVVQRITSLSGDELDNFMVYCNAYSGLKANATTYEVNKKIKDLFIEYKKMNPQKF